MSPQHAASEAKVVRFQPAEALESDLRTAMLLSQFRIHWQPIVT